MATTVTGAAWTPGMVVNAANVGINLITSGGTLTCASVSDPWSGAVTGNVIRSEVGKGITFKIEAQTFGGAPVAGDRGIARWWARCVLVDSSQLVDQAYSATNHVSTFYNPAFVIGLTRIIKAAGSPDAGSGLCKFVYDSVTSTGKCQTEGGVGITANGSANTVTTHATIGFNRWSEEFDLRVVGTTGTNNSKQSYGAHSQIISEVPCDIPIGTSPQIANANNFTETLPEIPGCYWELAQMKTESGTQAATFIPSNFSTTYRSPANHTRSRRWAMTYSTMPSETNTVGNDWTVTRSASTALVAVRPYSLGVLFGPPMSRLCGYVPSGVNVTIQQNQKVGLPDYHPVTGICWYVHQDIIVPGASIGTLLLRHFETTNTTALVDLRFDSSGTMSQFSGGAVRNVLWRAPDLTIGPVSCCVAYGFGSDGRKYWMILDKTHRFNTGSGTYTGIIASGQLDNWTPQTLGSFQLFFQAGANTYFEYAGMEEHRLPVAAMGDSFSEGASGPTSYIYVGFASSSRSLVFGDTIIDPLGGMSVVIYVDNTNKWWVGASATKWNGGNCTISGGGTVTTATAPSRTLSIGFTTSTGTPVPNQLLTELSGQTATVLGTPATFPVAYLPPNTMLVLPIGTLQGQQTAIGSVTGAWTGTLDIPQQGVYRAHPKGGTNSRVYDCGDDAYGPAFASPYATTDLTKQAIQLACTVGQSGARIPQLHENASISDVPGWATYSFAGCLTNSITLMTTQAAADAAATSYIQAASAEMVNKAENLGYSFIETPQFGSAAMWTATFARYGYDIARKGLLASASRLNRTGRIIVIQLPGFAASDDGVHQNITGAQYNAGYSSTNRTSFGGASSSAGGRAGRA